MVDAHLGDDRELILMVWRRMFGREELTPVESRQGFLDRPVLVVLIASIALVSVLFGLLLLNI